MYRGNREGLAVNSSPLVRRQRMRIAYLVHRTDGTASGVIRKIRSQAKQWVTQGAVVRIFLLCRAGQERLRETLRVDGVDVVPHAYSSHPERMRSTSELATAIRRWKPNVVYRRYDLFYPAFDRLAESIPTVVEVNTDDIAEYRLGSGARRWYNRLTRSRVFSRASGLVFVSGELAKREHFARYGKPSLVMGNGLDLRNVAPSEAPCNPTPRLIFIGAPGLTWHGVDKILWLAEQLPDWHFDLIGAGAGGDPLPANVVAHGLLEPSDYQTLMLHADVAFGTLALHRKAMDEASPLKVREYLANGIPTVIGYRDTDFPKPKPFLLQIPNTDNNVRESFREIVSFCERWKGRRVSRDEILHIATELKEERRLAFFEQIIEAKADDGVSDPRRFNALTS